MMSQIRSSLVPDPLAIADVAPAAGWRRPTWRAIQTCYVKMTGTLRVWAVRRRERHALANLDDHLLREIGVTRHDAEQEARLPFWRP